MAGGGTRGRAVAVTLVLTACVLVYIAVAIMAWESMVPLADETLLSKILRAGDSNRDSSSQPTVIVGIQSTTSRLPQIALLRSIMKVSMPADFTYEFVFAEEGLRTKEQREMVEREAAANGDCVVVREGGNWTDGEKHWKTYRWLEHTVKTKPWLEFLIKTDDDTLIVYPNLKAMIRKLDGNQKYVFFGRDDAMSNNPRTKREYMVGFMYGMSYDLAKAIVSNYSGRIFLEPPPWGEDLQTAFWVHALQGDLKNSPWMVQHRGRGINGSIYRGSQAVWDRHLGRPFEHLRITWVHWGDLIGWPEWSNDLWRKPLLPETVAIHGLKNLEQMVFGLDRYCNLAPKSKLCVGAQKISEQWQSVAPHKLKP